MRKVIAFFWIATFFFSIISLPADASESAYSLRYNTVMDANGNWVTQGGAYYDEWLNYNCYAFAIGRVEVDSFYPKGNGFQYQPGDMGKTGSFLVNQTVFQLAAIIVDDLEAMGYSNVETSLTIPSITASQELICVRRTIYGYTVDYHFMWYDLETDAWYHKPGDAAVLRYNGIPSTDVVWYGEHSDGDGEARCYPDYDSNIVFITYSKNQINVVDDVETSINIGNWVVDESGAKYAVDVYYELNLGEYSRYDITLESDYTFEYDIYTTSNDILNTDFAAVKSGTGTSISTRLDVIEGNSYYLRINFTTDVASAVDVTVEHQHQYTYEICGSATHHLSVCDCGYEVQTRHVVEQTTAFRAPCIRCGQLVRVSDANVGILGDQNIPEAA